jgi:hypothetical protein
MEPRGGTRRKIKPRCVVNYDTLNGLRSTLTEQLSFGIFQSSTR